MNSFLDLVREPDPCPAVVLAVLLYFLGGLMVQGRPRVYAWGARLAALVFLAYAAYSIASFSPATAGDYLLIALRALLASALALGCGWMLLSLVVFVYDHSLGPLLWHVRIFRERTRIRAAQRRLEREEAEAYWREQQAYEREAPQRARQQQEAQRRANEEAAAQKRRDDARSQCVLLYSLYAPEIGKRMPQSVLDNFIGAYLGDNRSPEEVEQRARLLQETIHQHRERVEPPPKFKTLEDIVRWFEEQKRQINALPDDRLRQTLLARLKARYTELTTQLLEEMRS